MRAAVESADKLYQRLMQMHEQTFDAGGFEVSYHLLAAAVHAAEELNSVAILEQLRSVAARRQVVATTAGATRARMAASAAVEHLRDRTGGAD